MGLKPNKPVNEAGIRIDPPPSAPIAAVANPAETVAAAPPLDPPGVIEVSHGFLASSPNLFSVVAD